MFPLLETAIAFALVMLTASLCVSAVVQLIVVTGRYRSRTLAQMLRSLIYSFRVFHNDSDLVDPDTGKPRPDGMERSAESELDFVHDVLKDPVLHARGERLAARDSPDRLSRFVDYIDADDLVALAYNATKTPTAVQGVPSALPVDAASEPSHVRAVEAAEFDRPLPDRWVGRVRGDRARAKAYATTSNFAAYVARWFATIEGTAAQAFKQRVRQLTVIVAATLVVLINFDGFRVLSRLYENSPARQRIMAQSEAVGTSATRLGVQGARPSMGSLNDRPDTSTKDFGLEVEKTATILDSTNLGIGWQDSPIVRQWNLYRGQGIEAPPSQFQILRDTLFWLAGLLFSIGMLSLGAPFWVTTFSRFINMRNEVQYRKERDEAPFEKKLEAKAWDSEVSKAEERGRISRRGARGREAQDVRG